MAVGVRGQEEDPLVAVEDAGDGSKLFDLGIEPVTGGETLGPVYAGTSRPCVGRLREDGALGGAGR